MTYKILLIDAIDYEKYPTGGILSFAKALLQTKEYELSLVGLTTNPNDTIGCWNKKTINDIDYDFFPLWYVKEITKKPMIPLRLMFFVSIIKFRKKIRAKNIPNILTQSHEAAIAISNWKGNKCFYFPGLENPLKIARYRYAKYISSLFEKVLFKSLTKFNLLIAAGDNLTISNKIDLAKKSGYILDIKPFPTRIDTSIFKPLKKDSIRKELGFVRDEIIVVTTGRLSWFKGWKLMIDSFHLFLNHTPNSKFIFLGDGEDRTRIINYIKKLNLDENIILMGKQTPTYVCKYLSAADLFVMGSFKEGWSTSLLEALACNLRCCVTPFSSAEDLITTGKSGFVVKDWDTDDLSKAMLKSIKISQPKNDISGYSLSNLAVDLNKIWLDKVNKNEMELKTAEIQCN